MKKIIFGLVVALLLNACGSDNDTVETDCPTCGVEMNSTVVVDVNEAELLCPDTRDGHFLESTDPAFCAEHGYFYCSIVKHCLDKPTNVNECGEIGSAQREELNSQ